MKAKLKILLVFGVLMLTQIPYVYSQESRRSTRKEKKAIAKQKRDRANKTEKAYEEALEAHRKRQGKKTEKRMKKNLRKTKRIKKNKRSLRKNWFKR